MNSTQNHTISRRKQKKAARKLKRAQSSTVRANADAALRNSRAARLHHILGRPGRGGLSAKGAEQLQQFFSKKVSESKKPSLREMDASAAMIMLQMAAEDVDAGKLTREELRQLSEDSLMASGAEYGGGGGDEEDGKAKEDWGMGETMEAKGDVGSEEGEELGDEDWEQGGVALANDW